MNRKVIVGSLLFSVVSILVTGCGGGGSKSQSGSGDVSPTPPTKLVIGVLSKVDTNGKKIVLIVNGSPVEYPIAEKVTFFSDPETKQTEANIPFHWYQDTIVATLEKQGGKEVIVSLRPPSKAQLPPDPPGTTVSGKFVGWNGKKHPDGKIALEVDGKKQEYPAATKMAWYDQFGFKVQRDQDQRFRNIPVTILLVSQGGRDEVAIIRSTEKK